MYLLVKTVFPDASQRQDFFHSLVDRQYIRSSGTQFDPSECNFCEVPLAFQEGRKDSTMTLHVQSIVDEMVDKLNDVPSHVRPILISFVIEKGINKLFFEDVHTDICFIIQCLANHLT